MSTLSVAILPERVAIEPSRRGRFGVAVRVRADGRPLESERAPLACVLVLDVSGSMGGPPIEMLIQSVEKLCELAQPGDELALVAFSDGASVVAPLTKMDQGGKRLLSSRARRLAASGGTNIEDGLRKGAEVLRDTASEARKSLIVLSDGQPNRGASSAADLAEIVRALRGGGAAAGAKGGGFSVSSLGYGTAHNEDTLAKLADAGAGRFWFIPSPASCRRDLAAALGAQGDVVAGSIELLVSPVEGVEIKRFVGSPDVRFGRAGAILSLSDMEGGSQRLLAIELELRGALDKGGKLLDLRATFVEPGAGAPRSIDLAAHVDVRSEEPPLDVDAAEITLLVRAEEARKDARALADRGQFDGADAVLRAVLREIEALANWQTEGSPLFEAHELLLDEAVAYQRNPSPESYSVFRKQTIMLKLDQDAARSVMPAKGPMSVRFTQVTGGAVLGARLVVERGPELGRAYTVGTSCAIGRTSGADIMIRSDQVSRRHAEVYALESEHWVCDLGSTNTTAVNGVKLTSTPHKLSPGDIIRVGDVELRYILQ